MPANNDVRADDIEKGIQAIVKLCIQPILYKDPKRQARTEEAVRNIIAAAAEAARADERRAVEQHPDMQYETDGDMSRNAEQRRHGRNEMRARVRTILQEREKEGEKG